MSGYARQNSGELKKSDKLPISLVLYPQVLEKICYGAYILFVYFGNNNILYIYIFFGINYIFC